MHQARHRQGGVSGDGNASWRCVPVRVLFVHPSGLMYSEIFLRLEPLGVERVAGAARLAGHEVRIVDLQVFSHRELEREIADFAPEAVGFGLNYLANVPEVIDLSRRIKQLVPGCWSSSAATACRSSPSTCSSRPMGRSTWLCAVRVR